MEKRDLLRKEEKGLRAIMDSKKEENQKA